MLRGIGDSSIWAGYRYRGFFFEQDLIRWRKRDSSCTANAHVPRILHGFLDVL